MIYADQRWLGNHGIGRFAKKVLECLDYQPIALATHPASPLDAYRLTRALIHLKADDLFFSPGYSAPVLGAAPFIFTLHDLNHIDRPENSSPLKRLYYSTVLSRACRRAAFVLTVSEFSRSRIISWAGADPDKVICVGCGVDAGYHPGVTPYPRQSLYLLCVSNRKLHKNEFRTLQAFAQARIPREVQILFTGNATPELSAWIDQNIEPGRVEFLGLIPDADLPSLYRSAVALIFVSLYEGFGLPALEAMACGTPVVTSNTSALLEIAADAALLVDPESVDAIADAIERVVTDTSIREVLRERGLARSANFSWATTTERVQNIIDQVR